MMITGQISRYEKHVERNPRLECIIPTSDELNYETSQVPCPHRDECLASDRCQKYFKNIMALNVHLQMYHKETGIVTAANKYTGRPGRYHCPVSNCIFHCHCDKDEPQPLSFSNFNAVRLHYLRQHGLKKEKCPKCSKSFGLHQDFVAHEKICGIDCPFPCPLCHQQFQNRTSLRRHQLKHHSIGAHNESQPEDVLINSLPALVTPIERLQRNNPRRRRRRPLPPDQVELSRQNLPLLSHQSVTINPHALELLKSFQSEFITSCLSSNPATLMESNLLSQSESDKATQTYTRVSVGTECCSLNNSDFDTVQSIPTRRMEQKSSQTQGRIRIYKRNARYSSKRTTASTITDDVPGSVTLHNVSTDVFNASTMTNWDNVPVTDMQTQISSISCSDMSIQTVGAVSNILHDSSEPNHSVIVQTLPISMTSTQMQTISDYPSTSTPIMQSYPSYLPPYQESVGTSCFLDEFLLDDFTKTDDHNSSVLFDFDAMDLLDLIDNGTQTHPLISTNETQTMTHWNSMLLNEDEWIQTIMDQ